MTGEKNKLSKTAVVFAIITSICHILFFAAESILWMEPSVHQSILSSSEQFQVEIFTQAKIMETVFFNQGFYNLFLAIGLFFGLGLYYKGYREMGVTLISYICLFCLGAALVLVFSTGAIAGAIVQGFPPLVVTIYVSHNLLSMNKQE